MTETTFAEIKNASISDDVENECAIAAAAATELPEVEAACVYPELKYRKKPVYEFIKRIFDICASFVALVLAAIPMLIVAIIIRREDGGPVFFKQDRVGKNGKIFSMYKFRSMCLNAESMKAELMDENEADGPIFKITDDPRITKIGKFIRRTSIDELPQLFNIIAGDMTVVGPRPLVVSEVEQMTELQSKRHIVKPGLTCFWQVGGRSNLSFDEMIALDFKYINKRSLWTDLILIFRTFKVVVSEEGAY